MDGINTTLNQGGNGGGGGAAAELAVSITYAALVALRDGGNLVPGTWYRITNYVCTTTQANTQAASNAFDILVHADDESHLNENAYAAHHDGDSYFADCKLEAWQLKYCLDNNTNRFDWADDTNGTGVVYWMKDEWDNEAPYDFKNIMFSRTLTNGAYDDHGTAAYVYTFNSYSDGTNSDASVLAATNNKIRCCNNVISEYRNTSSGDYKLLLLNNIVFLNVYANNTGYTCSGNKFGFSCFSNTFGNGFQYNSFGNGVNHNTFGNNCYNNTFGNNCVQNTFGNSCGSNTFGNECSSNTFGNNFFNNTFGNSCSGNTFGNGVNNNTFGNYCSENTFGNNCSYSTFGNYCNNNTFGNYCQFIVVSDGAEAFSVSTGSEGHPVQYCQVLGANYGGKNPLAIPFVAECNYTQVAGLDNNGNLVIFNPAEAHKS